MRRQAEESLQELGALAPFSLRAELASGFSLSLNDMYRVDRAKPYIIRPRPTEAGQEHAIPPDLLERYVSATRCINCFCCASACIGSHRSFLGPNAMLAAIVRVMDPREGETAERLKCLYSAEGVTRCHSSRACSFVCPKGIDVAHFIALAKQGRIAPQGGGSDPGRNA